MNSQKRDLKKVITECEENTWGVTFYGSDKELVEKALKSYRALNEQIEILENTVEQSEKEKYHLKNLKNIKEGVASEL